MKKKKRRGFFDDLFDQFDRLFEAPFEGSMSGYSIEIRSTPEGTEVHARTYGDTNAEELRRRLEQMYPGAKIVIEGEEESREIIRKEESEKIGEIKREEEIGLEGPRVSISFKKGEPIIIRHDEHKMDKPKKTEKKKEKKKTVEIIFRGGEPIIKRID